MGYKSLFTTLTDLDTVEQVLTRAIPLAERHAAHLEVLCLGVDRSQTGYYYAGANALVLQETITRARAEAEAIEARARALLDKVPILWSVESGLAQMPDLGRHVASRARFSDLALLAQPYGRGKGPELETVVEAAMFEGGTPVVVLPDNEAEIHAPQRILLGWNESPEALGAARLALPFMTEAASVHVVIVDPPTHGPDRSDPGGLLSQYLARHGLQIEIDVLSKTMPRVSDVLMRHARDIEADLVVMGAYGHSRFREAILGGATRYMLEQSDLPVFMAH